MDEEVVINEQAKSIWCISLESFHQNGRSFTSIIQIYLCPKCSKRLASKKKETSQEVFIANIQSCCSHDPDFINGRMPILESIFRLYLANGNKPLDLEQLGKQLSELRGGDQYRASAETLFRLLKNDRYYGLKEIKNESN